MIASLRPLTYDDLVDMPDDGQRYEIIDGELIVTPAPTIKHQRVQRSLIRILGAFAYETGRAELVLPPFDRMVIYNLQDKQYVPIESDAPGRFASRVFTGLRVDPAEVFSGLN
jgi:Uma2 family endonuclease